ncbi:MAG: metallophosphoesterase [Candidatus Devosia phytovorans]|uniref:Metallophosphoesterase n=1 Tax=Candidatus Devosia phytovorans TaxID=3121372 RepID=A0AAJ5VW80_9HYPH|nr:metallophosphoesterase [Devosia sp.]WEK05320.1 MAG: metallophosphoesterase [Devosia sp.]
MIIAQVSDIHANGSEEALDRFDRVVAWLRPMRPDVVIVSGDLVEDDTEQSYRAVRQRLEAIGAPFFVVPGNADDVPTMRRAFADLYGWAGEDRLNVVGAIGGLRVIGLDVTVPMRGHGDAGPVLDWLSAELNSSGDPALIFLHQHPFMTGIDGADRNHCYNQEALSLVIGKASDTVLGVTCGHVHRPMFTRFAGLPASMAPSVTRPNTLGLDGRSSGLLDQPGLLLHHVSEGRMVSHVVSVG